MRGSSGAALDRDAELGHPQIQQLVVRPRRPTRRAESPSGRARIGGVRSEARPGRQTSQTSSVPGDGSRSKSRACSFRFSRRCGIPERPSGPHRRVYESSCAVLCVAAAAGCHALLASHRPPLRHQSQPRGQPKPPAPDAHRRRRRRRSPTNRPSSRTRSSSAASKAEQKLIDAPATMSVITSADDRERAVGELRRAAAHDSRRQHHAGVGARHQRHEPRRDRHAGHRPAGAARRAHASIRTSSGS